MICVSKSVSAKRLVGLLSSSWNVHSNFKLLDLCSFIVNMI
jgi:hypothetical protein